MTNRKMFIIVSATVAFILVLVFGNIFFSVRQVIPYSAYYLEGDNAVREKEVEQIIVESDIIKKGRSMFTLNLSTLAKNIEEKFDDVRVIDIEKSYPNILYIQYELQVKQLEIFNGTKYFQVSNHGRVLSDTQYSQATDNTNSLIRVLWNDMGNSATRGYQIQDSNFLIASQAATSLYENGIGHDISEIIYSIDLNQIYTQQYFTINLHSSSQGIIKIYDLQSVYSSVKLAMQYLDDAIRGSDIVIKDGQRQ
ncbi:MAG: hypothetical protein LBU60_06695 [Clostridiales bacterium]|jgi:hypothetical protein|nr:hypothetical protein [Clostridiales bacterium]